MFAMPPRAMCGQPDIWLRLLHTICGPCVGHRVRGTCATQGEQCCGKSCVQQGCLDVHRHTVQTRAVLRPCMAQQRACMGAAACIARAWLAAALDQLCLTLIQRSSFVRPHSARVSRASFASPSAPAALDQSEASQRHSFAWVSWNIATLVALGGRA